MEACRRYLFTIGVTPREIVHSLVAVYGWWKPVGDVFVTIGVITRE